MAEPQPPVVEAGAVAGGGAARRALFLDRDGVINVNHGYVHSEERTDWVPGIFDLARTARSAGFAIVVVTNQAGIARGYYGIDQFERYTRWMHARFAQEGAPLLATYYCPHHPDAGIAPWRVRCDCRKPRPGMLLAAIRDWRIDPARSALVGDAPSDIEAARQAGLGEAFLVTAARGFQDVGAWLAAAGRGGDTV